MQPGINVSDRQLPTPEVKYKVIEAWHADSRALIAAGKAQRWDIVKWTITVNLALATASVSFQKSPGLFFLFAVGMAVIGSALAWHINYRMTRARRRLRMLNHYISKNYFDARSVFEEPVPHRGGLHDRQELWLYGVALVASIIPALTVWTMR